MKFTKNIQIWVIVASFGITIALLFGGQTLNAKIRVANPLKQKIQNVKAVQSFAVEPQNDALQLRLKLRQNSNLQAVVNQVKREVEFYHQKPVREIRISGNPNAQLEQVKYQLSFFLEEALATGGYIQLKTKLDSLEHNQGIKAKVYLDSDFIYLQLDAGKHYLYQAVARPEHSLALAANRIEGGVSP